MKNSLVCLTYLLLIIRAHLALLALPYLTSDIAFVALFLAIFLDGCFLSFLTSFLLPFPEGGSATSLPLGMEGKPSPYFLLFTQ